MKRHSIAAFLVWLGLTVAGELLLWDAPFLPAEFAHEAAVSDDAFKLLLRLAIPVAAFVLAMMIVSMISFHHEGVPEGDGPPLRGNRRIYWAWLLITTGLAIFVIVNPGLVGLAEISGGEEADLVVKVQGSQWFWTITYPGDPSTPDDDVTTTDELVLPVHQRVRFDISATDVLHSFWIPAFRIKMDAVPGHPTTTYATPTRVGTSASDFNLRLQCAELCGTGHSIMGIPVRVVEQADFEAWLEETRSGGAQAACEPSGTTLTIVAKSIAFDTKCLAAPAGEPFVIELDNQDPGTPHNISIAADEAWQNVLYTGKIFNGVATQTERIQALEAGTYFFRCDVHPIPAMSGTIVVGEPSAGEPAPATADEMAEHDMEGA